MKSRNRIIMLLAAAFLMIPTLVDNDAGSLSAQGIAINNNAATANSSSMLDISAGTTANRGLLIPRVTFAQRTTNFNPLPQAAQGLTVYQTDGGGLGEGYYYNTSTTVTPNWVKLGTGTSWDLLGNAGTTAGTNFIGTTDAVDWVVKTNNIERMRVLSGGNVGINNSAPNGKLEVSGTSVFNSGSANLDGAGIAFMANSAKLLIGWNRTAGGGETDFITNRGGGSTGGFRFYDYTNAGTENTLVTILGGGNVGIGNTNPGQKLSVAGSFGILEGGASPSLYSIFQGGDQLANITYTLPIAQGTTGSVLRNDGAGILSWEKGGFTKILDIVLTNATSYNLTGLDGDNDIGYRFILMGNHPNTDASQKFCWVSINGDITATNYSYFLDSWWNYSPSADSYDPYSVGGILLYATFSADNPSYICADAVLSAFSGTRRHAITQYSLGRGNTRNITNNLMAGVWSNTVSNITSLLFTFSANSGFTGRLIVYKFQS